MLQQSLHVANDFGPERLQLTQASVNITKQRIFDVRKRCQITVDIAVDPRAMIFLGMVPRTDLAVHGISPFSELL